MVSDIVAGSGLLRVAGEFRWGAAALELSAVQPCQA
jgi:hypothetical protein